MGKALSRQKAIDPAVIATLKEKYEAQRRKFAETLETEMPILVAANRKRLAEMKRLEGVCRSEARKPAAIEQMTLRRLRIDEQSAERRVESLTICLQKITADADWINQCGHQIVVMDLSSDASAVFPSMKSGRENKVLDKLLDRMEDLREHSDIVEQELIRGGVPSDDVIDSWMETFPSSSSSRHDIAIGSLPSPPKAVSSSSSSTSVDPTRTRPLSVPATPSITSAAAIAVKRAPSTSTSSRR